MIEASPISHVPLPWHRRIFGLKFKRDRDLAARDFLDHCLQEAMRLKDKLVRILKDHNPDSEIPRRLDSALGLPLLLVHGSAPSRTLRPLFDAHCLAILQAAGLGAMRDSIDPSHQITAMEWSVPWMIAADDVGKENIGHAPSPRTASGGRISWAPGTLVGGIPSPQYALQRRYRRFKSGVEALAMLLCATHMLRPDRGVRRILWTVVEEHDGIRSMSIAGYEKVGEEEVDEWDGDIEIFDPGILLSSELTKACVKDCLSVIGAVDGFWPTFSQRFKLTY